MVWLYFPEQCIRMQLEMSVHWSTGESKLLFVQRALDGEV